MGNMGNPFMSYETFFFFDTFGTDTWTDNGVTIGVSAGALQFTTTVNNDGSRKDMTGVALSDTAWVMRIKMDIAVELGAGNTQFMFGVFDNTVFDQTTVQDYLCYKIGVVPNATNVYYGNGVNAASGSNTTFTHAPAVETLYIEFSRLSATSFKIELFSDATYTTSVEAQTATISSAIIGLRYLKAQCMIFTAGTFTGSIDDVYVKNGVTAW